ncbi:hypothetical protein Asppvi_001739 [Aspergillus pseudoviridinutans]|uniref:chitinase n=1 Tax=Aspergillus pseudoviridinutans TaxID=1517512 RepID=A0A9P3B838_9EURO|nr:uncharacterized protein Asppvi_001739 [Aspergillus pseudoviridinutans]GIJ83219.1 hypothetical protein Asppvi_001739 [Aspergillus pseudoviridinutans]
MARSGATRRAFIESLINFMQTWGFDGVDLDWEYPGAEDRGGVAADTANYVLLLKDLKDAFGGRYGLSVTLPASYWYLRWFDLPSMQEYVDFFNIMTYDIHGVWDASNKFTGPYVRPHTNLTEIKQGLDLLWRNKINPSAVNMGIGWYGRSFTLQDPTCDKPGCIFRFGGNPGECTKSSGTLSNAEIQRIIARTQVNPTIDREAAVKWIKFDTDQWVSYDDGETIQMKMSAAGQLCLGGSLIWALDQDSADHTSSNDLLGLGTASGVAPEDAAKIRTMQTDAQRAATIRNSCYWSFCGEACVPGYIAETYAKGQVMGIERDTVCRGDNLRTLCCAPGTNTGSCSWYGWRGVGMPCYTNSCPAGTDLVAANTNSYLDDSDGGVNHNLTCNGGSQSYCCSGFVPSSFENTDSLPLIGQQALTKRSSKPSFDPTFLAIANTVGALLGGSTTFVTLFWNYVLSPFQYMPVEDKTTSSWKNYAGVIAHQIGQGALGPGVTDLEPAPTPQPTKKPKAKATQIGRYKVSQFGPDDEDCETTYTCAYGQGWDEICDNQRWAIDKALNGKRVYHKAPSRPEWTYKDKWPRMRHKEYASRAKQPVVNGRVRCDVDEFPLASLEEAGRGAYQVVRFVNGQANAAQGQDWNNWLVATWTPCSQLRATHGKSAPPITWSFGPFQEGDRRINARTDGEHFIEAYGFNSQIRGGECWATYTYTTTEKVSISVVVDQGFRALPDDPMFRKPYVWPSFNNYKKPPSSTNLPRLIADTQWLKREIALGVLEEELPLSAIYEAEKASVLIENQESLNHAYPTVSATSSLSIGRYQDASRPVLRSVFPIQTGAVASDSPMMERRMRHLNAHRHGG